MKRWYVSDMMTPDVVTVTPDMGYKEIADLLVARGVSAVPVIDERGHVCGVISEADLLAKLEFAEWAPRHPLATRRNRTVQRRANADTAAGLMSTPPITVQATETVTATARVMDRARVKWLPVLNQADQLVGVVARRDLLRLYTRTDEQIQATVTNDLLSALWIDPSAVRVSVRAGIVTLSGRLDRRSTATIAAQFTLATPGVVDVVDELEYEMDDGALTRSHQYPRAALRT